MGAFRTFCRVFHWGPLLALFVIAEITISGLYCLLQWWPVTTTAGFIHLIVYLQWDVLILYNFFSALYGGPGYVKKGWAPENKSDEQNLQYCIQCEGFKAPRSHHCRKCQRCVMKMDHHCPWINNCVGHANHGSFTMFVFFAPIGCIHALCVLIPSLYRAINRNYYLLHGVTTVPIVTLTPTSFFACLLGLSLSVGVTVAVEVLFVIQRHYLVYGTGQEPIIYLGLKGFLSAMFGVGLAVGVALAVAILFAVQIRSVLKNESGIESWIKDKAEYREREDEEKEFIFPYDLGRWKNFTMVFHIKDRPELNGIWWPVRDDCNQYTLTIEQIKQKREKGERSVVYTIHEPYSGSLFPITKGLRVCCCPPCTDEARVPLTPGDRILVSRWKKRWLYGDKLMDDFEKKKVKRIRGWFPRRCAVEVYEEQEQQPQQATPSQPSQNGSHSSHNNDPASSSFNPQGGGSGDNSETKKDL